MEPALNIINFYVYADIDISDSAKSCIGTKVLRAGQTVCGLLVIMNNY